jgi:hypothetical protein
MGAGIAQLVQRLATSWTTEGQLEAGHSGRAVWGMNFLRSLERWDRGFESHSRHGCLFVLGSGLATGWSLVQGVLSNVLN